jgi:hypothetical protein
MNALPFELGLEEQFHKAMCRNSTLDIIWTIILLAVLLKGILPERKKVSCCN